jgi:RimJ/RimL family protein N-acetyltransferase
VARWLCTEQEGPGFFGYPTEAARAVLEWAADAGYRRVWAGVGKWNGASLRVLQKLAFVDTGQDELDTQGPGKVVTDVTGVTWLAWVCRAREATRPR